MSTGGHARTEREHKAFGTADAQRVEHVQNPHSEEPVL
jgi:hypothetical protein